MERLGDSNSTNIRGGHSTNFDNDEIGISTNFSNVGDNFSSTNSSSRKGSNIRSDNDRGMCWEKATESQKEFFGCKEDFEEYAKFRRMKSREDEHLVSCYRYFLR